MFAVAALGRPAPTPSCWRPVTDPEAAELLRRRFLEGRRELIRQMWRRGEQRGELRTDVDVKSPRTSCSAPSSSASSLATPPSHPRGGGHREGRPHRPPQQPASDTGIHVAGLEPCGQVQFPASAPSGSGRSGICPSARRPWAGPKEAMAWRPRQLRWRGG
ncbi:TetR-like C-terminal domain-containing protein [Nonomuraea recticatena]|uniref:TetR-like C-terminal domain-containing protein n=1 Tax=Nonomuraea recticatena TaxID=46178 RepID=UPI003D1569AB